MGRVEGKVAIVTGAASGLGAASARLLAREGARVVITDINVKDGQALANSLGEGAIFLRHDVSDEAQWVAIIEQTLSRFGRLDILVNNAGVVVVADVEHTTVEDWRFVNAVGTDGTFFGCKHAIPAMRRSGGGSIVNLSSLAGIGGYPLVFAYSASKGAIRAMTKSVAVHCAQNKYNIRCNSIHPGGILTPLVEGFIKSAVGTADASMDKARDLFSKLGEPDDVAYMVLYLASDESKFVSGSEFIIDNTATITEGVVPT
ncbi:oxidoreductase, short-chain dehydrogenase/reductase family [Geobacter metallireducens GS-15]|uniref:Oxidoreductase, short-chain dehydrogenase/reductase family n=1 Tax=Geobacter metallireducens (strain ATCC 53774 / DSM 7210 / GS-15) TaxID=269799 RepID=Q39TI0_GEOMG|nr:glucose 1-dehydrogenase [Geobacter metallireducens]ABB32444.1 oxidoreductase, short-chain dehydrogenase/reductase family [Geobacter metallireducens GS-15]